LEFGWKIENQGLSFFISLSNILSLTKDHWAVHLWCRQILPCLCEPRIPKLQFFTHNCECSLWQLFSTPPFYCWCLIWTTLWQFWKSLHNAKSWNLSSIYFGLIKGIHILYWYIHTRAATGGKVVKAPWLDIEKYKMAVAAAANQWSGRHYGFLAGQKYTVAALHTGIPWFQLSMWGHIKKLKKPHKWMLPSSTQMEENKIEL